jgi:hypothetical protein
MEILNKDDIPCGPILSMKELAEDQSLRATGTVVEVDHPERGKYLSVGNPIKMSDSPSDVTRSPLLGEHTDEILRQVLGFTDQQVAEIHDSAAQGRRRVSIFCGLRGPPLAATRGYRLPATNCTRQKCRASLHSGAAQSQIEQSAELARVAMHNKSAANSTLRIGI